MDLVTSTRDVGGVTIADLRGRIVLGDEGSAHLRKLVSELLSQGRKKILLNLAEVTYIDTSGLASLISALAQARKQGGELKLVNLSQKVQDLMQITKLHTVFDIYNDEAAAVRSFSQAAAATSKL
jgi:anti-sigma B factor antagonist